MKIVEYALKTIANVDLVVIDGIRNMNSPSGAASFISMLMQWTDDIQIHIHIILHQNKNDEHAWGNIGAEFKTLIQVGVDRVDKNISSVEPFIRGKKFAPFAFCINDATLLCYYLELEWRLSKIPVSISALVKMDLWMLVIGVQSEL